MSTVLSHSEDQNVLWGCHLPKIYSSINACQGQRMGSMVVARGRALVQGLSLSHLAVRSVVFLTCDSSAAAWEQFDICVCVPSPSKYL